MHGIADPRLPAGRARPKDLPRGRSALTDDIEQQLAGGALAARGGAARLIDGGIGVAGRVGRSSEDEPDVADDCGPRGLVQWAHHRRDIIILAPAAAGRRRFCRVLRRRSVCSSAPSGLGRVRGCEQLDGKAARVRRGRGADSCLHTHADVCIVCACTSAPCAVCKPGMARVLRTSSLLPSSRMPIDRVPLGSDNIE